MFKNNSQWTLEKSKHDDQKEDEKLIDQKIKEHVKEDHSLQEHQKQHNAMNFKKEEDGVNMAEVIKIDDKGQWSL